MLKKVIIGITIAASLSLSTSLASDFFDTFDLAPKNLKKHKNDFKLADPIAKFNNKKSHGFIGRAAMGYDFNANLGIEAGFSVLHAVNKKYNISEINFSQEGNKNKTSLYTTDLMGKLTLPLESNLYVFTKVGIVFLQTKINGKTRPVDDNGEPLLFKPLLYLKNYLRPKIAAGIGFHITDKFSIDLSYSQIFKQAKASTLHHLPNLRLTTVSIVHSI